MLKRFCLCLIVCLLFLPAGTVKADVIDGNDFEYKNRTETEPLMRYFYANSTNGYVSELSEPTFGTQIREIENGTRIWIESVYVHKGRYWGYKGGYFHGITKPGWVPMDELLLSYGHEDFNAEYQDVFYDYTDNGGIRRVLENDWYYFWRWPGSDMEKRKLYGQTIIHPHFLDYLYNHSPFGSRSDLSAFLDGAKDDLPYTYNRYLDDYLYGKPEDHPDNYFDFLLEYNDYLFENYVDAYCESIGLDASDFSSGYYERGFEWFYKEHGQVYLHDYLDSFRKNYVDYNFEEIRKEFDAKYAYKDNEGREWVYFVVKGAAVGFHSNVNEEGWICVDDPANADIPPFKPAPDPIRWSPKGNPDWYGVREPLIDDNGDNTEYSNGENGEGNEFEISVPLIIVASLVFISAVVMVIYVFRNSKKME